MGADTESFAFIAPNRCSTYRYSHAKASNRLCGFNQRRRLHGHLFQNRYKSILCQEDPYLLELVRYIHLNPLRARLVAGLRKFDKYPYSGHSVLMCKAERRWQNVDYVLKLFERSHSRAIRRQREFVKRE